MVELGQLEASHAEFAKRNTRIVVASVEEPAEVQKTQAQFTHLTFVADGQAKLTQAAGVVHKGAGHSGEDISTPTTFLIDPAGSVQWIFRPDSVLTRGAPKELLAVLDR